MKIKRHKIITVIAVLILIGGGYYGYGKFKGSQVETSYITAAVEKGTLIVSISGSGQISVSNQVDIKAKVSGDITKIAVVNGQQVKTGDLIAQLDTREAYKTVRDAQSGLASAQLAMDKLKQPADSYSLMQAENALTNAKASLEKLKLSQPADYQTAIDDKNKAEDSLIKTYEDAFNTIVNVYIDLPTMMEKLNNILYSKEISESEPTFGQSYGNIAVLENSAIDASDDEKADIKTSQILAEADFKKAQAKYAVSFLNYKNASRYSDRQTVGALLDETLEITRLIAQSVKSESNFLDAWSDAMSNNSLTIFSKVKEYQASLGTFVGQTNSSLSTLLTSQASIQSDKEAIITAQNNLKTLSQNQPLDLAAAEASLKEKQASLAKLKAGTDPLDIRSQELSLQQKRNALYDAQAALADYTIRAPFDGVIASINLKIGDSASGAAIATLITKQKIAEISLNEVDVAKIKVGDKVTLTFDAIEELTISGQVGEIDSIGAVSQGVVTYNVKISFDTQDNRVKSGMSTNATIITNAKTDVLMVSNSAVKTDNNGGSYVQTLGADGQPKNILVQIGLANDTSTEITNGLKEGDKVITQIISSAAKTAAPTNTRAGGGGFGVFSGGR